MLKRFIPLTLIPRGLCLNPPPVHALVNGSHAEIRGGTLKTIPPGTEATIDLGTGPALILHLAPPPGSPSPQQLRIPYERVKQIRYEVPVARHLGVLPAMAAGLVRKRERKHILTLTFLDGEDIPQVLELEISKSEPPSLLTTTRARALNATEICNADEDICRNTPIKRPWTK